MKQVNLRVPLNPEFCREVAEFLGFFLADFGGSVRNRRKMVKKVGKRFCMGLEVKKSRKNEKKVKKVEKKAKKP